VLADAVMAAWDLVEGKTLAEAYATLTEGLVSRPHPWARGYLQLDCEASSGLDDARMLHLALLALGELPTCDARAWERPCTQPWFRAYLLLCDLCLDEARFVALSPALAWLSIDAILDGLPFDERHNSEQAAAGWIWTALDRRCDDPRLAERRMLALVERAFEADGYDTGSMDSDLRDIADHIGDPKRAAELRLMHAYLSYATEPWQAHRREQLARALRERAAGLDVAAVRDACTALMGSWSTEPLPLEADEVPGDRATASSTSEAKPSRSRR
jgi:hypothetical protein